MVHDKVVDYSKAGKRIKVARIEREWSQEDLAEKADLSVTFLSNIENAHSKASLATFVKIANALGTSIDELICDSIKECRIELDKQLAALTVGCSDYEMRIIAGVVKGLIGTIRDAEAYQKRIDGCDLQSET